MHKPIMFLFGKHLYGTTWLNGQPTTKFFGLNDFSNMDLFYILILFWIAIPYLRSKNTLYKITILVMCTFSQWIIHSRAGMVLYTLSAAYIIIEMVPKKYRRYVIGLITFIVVVLCALEFNNIVSTFEDKIIYGNEDSTQYRVALELTSIKKAINESPIIGIGVKRVFRPGESYVAYLGSHSTYIGFFYKTGIIGLFIGFYIFIISNYRVLKYRKNSNDIKNVIGFLLSCMILFAIEDVDGTNWSIFVYFSALAMFWNYGRNVKYYGIQKDKPIYSVNKYNNLIQNTNSHNGSGTIGI